MQQGDEQLADQIAEFYDDPLGHVLFSYPWGEGQLKGRKGPDKWQRVFLQRLGKEIRERGFDGIKAVNAIKFSVASGHGVGKSALVAWLIRWIMDTRPHCRGMVTANTALQLRTKTWAELAKWHAMGITAHWYQLNAGTMGSLNYYRIGAASTWRVDAQTCEERNSEAFAGLHNASSTPFFLFDEASAVPDKFFEVREGGMTDGEPMIFDFGNPTRGTGRFHANMKGIFRDEYIRYHVDSREVEITNKDQIARWAKTYGEDSDFFKVRVKGEFPSTGALQFISTAVVEQCVGLDVYVAPNDPLIIGVDVARFGDDKSVIYIRRGRDAESQGIHVFQGLDTMQLAARVAALVAKLKPDAVFVDGGGVGGGVVDRLRQLSVEVIEVNFGAKATQKGYANMRAQCWGNMRDALMDGIRLPDNEDLKTDLTGLEFGYTIRNDIQLESKEDAKKRGVGSPDLGDGLAITYAYPVIPARLGHKGGHVDYKTIAAENDYDPLG